MEKFTIVICTYNRHELLTECLHELLRFQVDHELFKFMVIDNNSSDLTSKVVEDISDRFEGKLSYIVEKNQGLSFARNRAIKEVSTKWIVYLDDDAKVESNFFKEIIKTSLIPNIQVFGGLYLPWYKYGKPRWYKESYGSNKMKYNTTSKLPESLTLSGGIMCFEKNILLEYDGFLSSLGMNGQVVGYGEETELQVRMHKNNIPIYYNPKIVIFHVVAKVKLDVIWHIKSYFALGEDMIMTKNISVSQSSIIKNAVLLLVTFFGNLILFTPKLLLPNYYLENWLMDVFRKPVKRLAMLCELSKRLNSTRKQSFIFEK